MLSGSFSMHTPLDNLVEALERRKKQLDDVLEAYKAFRQKLEALPQSVIRDAEMMLAATESPLSATVAMQIGSNTAQDLVGKTALECARTILGEHKNEPMHFAEIAKEAMRRGYKGRASGSPEKVESRTIQSFWAAMSRAEDFEATGKGCYWVKVLESGDRGAASLNGTTSGGRREELFEFLRRHGPLPRKRIIEQSGIPEGTIGMLLKDGPFFGHDVQGRWYAREGADLNKD